MPERRQFFKTYADIKFGKDVMTFERLDALFTSPIISHLLVFTDAEKGGEIGVATLYLEGQVARILLLRVLRPELLRAQPRHVHDDLGGGAVRGAQLQKPLSRHVLFGQRALQDAVRRRRIFQRLPLVGQSGRTEIHHQARQKGFVPASARNGGIP
jgi:hypothetical protein